MSYEYSENILVQNSAGYTLETKLGWEVVFAYDKEVLGENGTLGRYEYSDIVLKRYLKRALFDNNDFMTEAYCDEAVNKLLAYASSVALMQINEEKYLLLRDGIPVDFVKPDGTKEVRTAKVFNFDEPKKNSFIAVKELKIKGTMYRRRTDIVGFVNGIPLLFIELKKQNVDVKTAYECNYKDYLDTIPQLFRYNAMIILSNGLEAKVGTLGSKYEFFHEWKRLKEEDSGSVELETMLLGLCNKSNFMDLFENFILFDHSSGKTAKILARNHQYMGVNEAVESYKARKLKNGKLGVFWHTQGSGKSYSMVFLANKIRRKFIGSPTFLVLTDRDELNKQISDTFAACGCLGNVKASKYIPSSGADLISMLKGNPSFIFTLIQKFNNGSAEPISPKHDIIVISDEAHRTQNGIFADNLCRMLPTCSRIGFTGTPLFSYDNITERTFGSYVSIYDFKRSVEDGATVPLYYENRGDMLHIDNPQINDELLNAVEEADLDENQRAKFEMEISKDIHIITAEPRLEAIARDFVNHYTSLWTTGKAMFVCINKVTCVRMFNLAQKYWGEKILELEKQLKFVSQQEAQELSRKIDWMKETEMAVIVSQEQNEIQSFKNWGLDILPHRQKMERREMDKEFKNSENPFRIVFVCAMWLTGFDVKSLATIYIDKPLKAHTLMQAIARANRVCDGKSNGLIVDYIGVVKALRQALSEYTVSSSGASGNPLPDKRLLIERIAVLLEEIQNFMFEKGFNLSNLIEAENFEKLALVLQGANAMTATDDIRRRFGIQARELFKLCKYIEYEELDLPQHKSRDAISAIYEQMQEKKFHADNSELMANVNDIVSKYIEVEKSEDGVSDNEKKFDISRIDFNKLRKEFERVKNKNLLLKDLQDIIEERLAMMLSRNPLRIDYYEKYREIIDEYNKDNEKDEIAITFQKLMEVAESLTEEEKRYIREGFDSDEELAIFDLLSNETLSKEEIKKVKVLSKDLLTTIKQRIHELDHWRDKEETQAIISVLIRDFLFKTLPKSYADETLSAYREKIYEYVYNAYPAA